MKLDDFAETIILLDTEYTAWEGSMERKWSGENEHREIVQIAAIKVDSRSLEETDYISLFVKPTINPELSEYFTTLTGIRQEQIEEHGVSFSDAFRQYVAWAGNVDTYSFGRDEKVLIENCELNSIPFTCENAFFEARDVFIKYGIPAHNYQSGNIVNAFGAETPKGQHEALNDVRTILDGLRLLEARLNETKV